ncbi:MAG: L-rhamnose mutarotase [Devosia sp.]
MIRSDGLEAVAHGKNYDPFRPSLYVRQMVIGIRPEKLAGYQELHAQSWPEMNAALSAANLHSYSIQRQPYK